MPTKPVTTGKKPKPVKPPHSGLPSSRRALAKFKSALRKAGAVFDSVLASKPDYKVGEKCVSVWFVVITSLDYAFAPKPRPPERRIKTQPMTYTTHADINAGVIALAELTIRENPCLVTEGL